MKQKYNPFICHNQVLNGLFMLFVYIQRSPNRDLVSMTRFNLEWSIRHSRATNTATSRRVCNHGREGVEHSSKLTRLLSRTLVSQRRQQCFQTFELRYLLIRFCNYMSSTLFWQRTVVFARRIILYHVQIISIMTLACFLFIHITAKLSPYLAITVHRQRCVSIFYIFNLLTIFFKLEQSKHVFDELSVILCDGRI